MINFIIYEDNKKCQEYYKKVIFSIMENRKDKYHILTFNEYTPEIKKIINNLIGKNIFLLDMEVPGKSGLDLAREIRNSGDWNSQIIMITSYESFKEEGFTSRILMLDFISKNGNLLESIKSAILLALNIHSHYKSFNFVYNNELYQIPYDDILYFEKDLNNNYTSIITKNKINESYKIKQSIKNIETELLEVPYFFKTHQSCIVNINNIKKVDFKENKIYFSKQSINLLSRNKKKELKEKIAKEYIA